MTVSLWRGTYATGEGGWLGRIRLGWQTLGEMAVRESTTMQTMAGKTSIKWKIIRRIDIEKLNTEFYLFFLHPNNDDND